MKKRLMAFLLAGCMVCSVAACGTADKAENEVQTEEGTTEEDSALGTSTIVELGAYKGLTYKPYDTTVTDEEVETEMQYLVQNSTVDNPLEVATGKAIVNIDYVGTKDGVAFEGGTAQGQELDLGNSTYIEGFAESIVGMKVGETKDCPMTFPENYGVEELNGAEVVFKITLNKCWEKLPAELNDEFAVSQGYENVEQLYGGMRQLCELAKEQNAITDMKTQLQEQVIENTTFDITEEEISVYVGQQVEEISAYASYYGYDLETYVTSAGITMEQFEADCRESAILRIQTALLQEWIAKEEGITVSEEEYAKKAEEYMTYYGYSTLEEFEAAYTREAIEKQVLADLTMAVIVENAVEEK